MPRENEGTWEVTPRSRKVSQKTNRPEAEVVGVGCQSERTEIRKPQLMRAQRGGLCRQYSGSFN